MLFVVLHRDHRIIFLFQTKTSSYQLENIVFFFYHACECRSEELNVLRSLLRHSAAASLVVSVARLRLPSTVCNPTEQMKNYIRDSINYYL